MFAPVCDFGGDAADIQFGISFACNRGECSLSCFCQPWRRHEAVWLADSFEHFFCSLAYYCAAFFFRIEKHFSLAAANFFHARKDACRDVVLEFASAFSVARNRDLCDFGHGVAEQVRKRALITHACRSDVLAHIFGASSHFQRINYGIVRLFDALLFKAPADMTFNYVIHFFVVFLFLGG